jgi:hypothetical protein
MSDVIKWLYIVGTVLTHNHTVCMFTVIMSIRKSARILKEIPVNEDIEAASEIDEVKAPAVPRDMTAITMEEKLNDVCGAEVEAPAETCVTTAVIMAKNTRAKFDDVYGIHFKPSGNVISTGSLAEANLILGQLPESVTAGCAVYIKHFASIQELEAFRHSLKDDLKAAPKGSFPSGSIPKIIHNGKPEAEYDVKRSNLKRSEHPIEIGLDDIPEVHIVTGNTAMKETSNSNDDQSSDSVLANQSPAAKRMRNVIRTKGMKLIIHYWPVVPGSAVAQIVFIDIIDTRQDFTHWLQRPEKWVDVFGNIEQECANTPNPLGKFFTQMRCAHFRAPSGDNVSHTKIVKGNDGGTKLTLHRQGLYTYLPHGQNSDSIREHIKRNMARVLNDYDIQVCYRMIMADTSRNIRIPDLLNPRQAGVGGVFWDQLQGAVDGMEFVPHSSLKEVFLNNEVINITKSLFNGVTDQMFTSGSLPADIDAFAHGVPL